MPKILILGEDDALRQSLVEQLEQDTAFACTQSSSADEALIGLRAADYDAVLLDSGLSNTSAPALCRRLRHAAPEVAIIVLTERGSEAETAGWLHEHADDCIPKPIRLSALLERLRIGLRSRHRGDAVPCTIGRYHFQPSAKLLIERAGGKNIRLTEKETAILDYLYRAGGRVIDRDTLLASVWGYRAAVTTHTLETHVYRLRQKIEHDPAHAELLVTEAGGYRLVA